MALRKLRALRHALVATILTGSLLPMVSTGVASAAASIPPGFVLRPTDTGFGAQNLTDFGYLPDNSVLATGKDGRINWVPKDGSTAAPKTIASLPVKTNQDLGLIGLAIAPDFATSHSIYLTRALGDTTFTMRMSRFTVTLDGDGVPNGVTNEQVLFEVPGTSIVHSIDTVIAAKPVKSPSTQGSQCSSVTERSSVVSTAMAAR